MNADVYITCSYCGHDQTDERKVLFERHWDMPIVYIDDNEDGLRIECEKCNEIMFIHMSRAVRYRGEDFIRKARKENLDDS